SRLYDRIDYIRRNHFTGWIIWRAQIGQARACIGKGGSQGWKRARNPDDRNSADTREYWNHAESRIELNKRVTSTRQRLYWRIEYVTRSASHNYPRWVDAHVIGECALELVGVRRRIFAQSGRIDRLE